MTSTTTGDAGPEAMCDQELTCVIHEEINSLPEKYRAAVVLCYLEGLTHEMAAERLGWPVGSVKSRLAWARERLRVRLTRRGVAPALDPFQQSGSSRDAEPAPTPGLLGTELAQSTLRGALKAGMGKGALAGIVSAEAVALMDGMLKSLASTRLILMTASILSLGLAIAGLGGIAYSAMRQENGPRAGNPGQDVRPSAAAPQSAPEPSRTTVTKASSEKGPVWLDVEVVDPEGRPLARADLVVRIRYVRGPDNKDSVVVHSQTDAHGRAACRGRSRTSRGLGPERVHLGVKAWSRTRDGKRTARGERVPCSNSTEAEHTGAMDDHCGRPGRQPGRGAAHHASLVKARRARRRANRSRSRALRATSCDHRRQGRGHAELSVRLHGAPVGAGRRGGRGCAHIAARSSSGQKLRSQARCAGRLVGIVRTASGSPLGGVPIEVWVRGTGTLPKDFAMRGSGRITNDEILVVNSDPLRSGPQGAFQTPRTLLGGLQYRVSIREQGFVPYLSDWVALDGERTTIPPIRLQPLQKLTGQINDRQGRAVVGARVFLPAGGPGTTTDAEGRFVLNAVSRGKAVILVELTGFRLQGWVVEPEARPDVGKLTLARISEAPASVVKPQADPITDEESHSLALRLLEPYLPP